MSILICAGCGFTAEQEASVQQRCCRAACNDCHAKCWTDGKPMHDFVGRSKNDKGVPLTICEECGLSQPRTHGIQWRCCRIVCDICHWAGKKTDRDTADSHQVGGTHYKQLSIQPWTALESWLTLEEFKGFLLGNAIKYLARCKHKGGIEDLKKASHYLDKLIEVST